MRVLVDTCVVIDVLQHREPFWEDSYAAFLAIAESRNILSTLLIPFDLLDSAGMDCRRAISSDITDFEDAVMVESAVRAGMDCIMTRNLKDYEKSAMPVYSPADFLQKLQPVDE